MEEIMFSFFCASSNSKMNLSLNHPGTSAPRSGLTCFSLLLEDTLLVGHIHAFAIATLWFSLCFALSPYSTSICSTDFQCLGLGTISPFTGAAPHHQPGLTAQHWALPGHWARLASCPSSQPEI